MSEIKERLALCSERIRELAVTGQKGFWRDCMGLSLGEPADEKWLDYRLCREKLGPRQGVFLCLLYAQVWQVAARSLHRAGGPAVESLSDTAIETVCVTRELLLLICGQLGSGAGPDDIRDSLYWFYLDYCGLLCRYVTEETKGVFGGAMLSWPQTAAGEQFAGMHTWDCGLFLGNRYAARLEDALRESGAGGEWLRQLIRTAEPGQPASGGYLLTEHQKDVFAQLAGRS